MPPAGWLALALTGLAQQFDLAGCLGRTPAAVFLDEGELGAHLAERAAAWLAAVPPLFPRLGLQLTAHFSRLMPLLLGWCVAPRQSVRAAALEALLEVIRLTWPRIGAHAAVLWRVLRRVYDEERHRWAGRGWWAESLPGGAPFTGWCIPPSHPGQLGRSQSSGLRLSELLHSPAAATPSACRPQLGAGGDQAAAAVADCAEDCALALWYAAGPDFHLHLMMDKSSAGEELLQVRGAVRSRVPAGCAVSCMCVHIPGDCALCAWGCSHLGQGLREWLLWPTGCLSFVFYPWLQAVMQRVEEAFPMAAEEGDDMEEQQAA